MNRSGAPNKAAMSRIAAGSEANAKTVRSGMLAPQKAIIKNQTKATKMVNTTGIPVSGDAFSLAVSIWICQVSN